MNYIFALATGFIIGLFVSDHQWRNSLDEASGILLDAAEKEGSLFGACLTDQYANVDEWRVAIKKKVCK